MRFFLLAITLLFFTQMPWADLLINEFLTDGEELDDYGNPIEWIEIHNSGEETINLKGYGLTDDPLVPRKWVFPTIELEASSYLQILTSGYGFYNPGEYHANFRLQRRGEYIGLYNPQAELVDSIHFPEQEEDVSFGRNPNDLDEWLYFEDPTPGEENSSEGLKRFAIRPTVDPAGGFYEQEIEVTLHNEEDKGTIRYTLDGSPPERSSPRYTKPITLDQTTPLRARVFHDEFRPSQIISHTYFLNESRPLPVLSLITDPPDLWDSQIGIYANPTRRGFDWERPVAVEYFDEEGSREFGVNAGLRIHGGASRQRSDKKSFRLYFRGDYGPGWLEYPLIPEAGVERFDSFVLRAGYNDSWIHWDQQERDVAVYLSDQLGRNVHDDMGSVSSHGTYVNLYLNGEYWGLYNPCERYDGDFFEQYYGFPEWDIISDDEVKEGDKKSWNEMFSYLNNHDLSQPEVYEEFKTMVDIPQVTSYYILNVWVQNHDWPHHNWYAARERTPYGKWKLFVWDIEDSFGSGASRGSYRKNTFSNAQNNTSLGRLLSGLLKNDEYKQYFVGEFEHYLADALSLEHLHQRLDQLADEIRPAMPMEAQRWNTNKSLAHWEEALDIARTFIDNRTEVIMPWVYRMLQIPTPTPTLTPTPIPPTPTLTPTPIYVPIKEWMRY